MKRQVMLALLFLTTSFGHISISSAGSVIDQYRTINDITVGQTGHVYIYTSGTEINPAFCTGIASRYTLPNDHRAFNRIYALLLTSAAAGYEVRATVDDSACTNNSPEAISFRVRQPR